MRLLHRMARREREARTAPEQIPDPQCTATAITTGKRCKLPAAVDGRCLVHRDKTDDRSA